jgi:transmembrane 9 superfamily protein 2/4
MQQIWLKLLGALLLLAHFSTAYYLPGTYPQEFYKGEFLSAEVNSLVSSETEIPFDYYTMPFCKPPEGIKKASNTINPGTILMGIRI